MSVLRPGHRVPSSERAKVRLFAVDVDGTLLTSSHEVTDGVRAAVGIALQRGAQILLTTSRPPRAVWPILRRLGLLSPSAFIGSQGGIIGSYTQEGELVILERHPMTLEHAQEVVAAATVVGLAVNWFAGEEWFVSELTRDVRREAQIVGCEPEVVDLGTLTAAPEKLLVIAPPDAVDRLVAVSATLPSGVRAQTSNPSYLEITDAGVDKAAALQDFCDARGITAGEVVAMGDGMNDLGMLRFAGTAVAPSNARDAVRAEAHLITSSNDDDGVAHALLELSC